MVEIVEPYPHFTQVGLYFIITKMSLFCSRITSTKKSPQAHKKTLYLFFFSREKLTFFLLFLSFSTLLFLNVVLLRYKTFFSMFSKHPPTIASVVVVQHVAHSMPQLHFSICFAQNNLRIFYLNSA